jgi:cell division protease FtsH
MARVVVICSILRPRLAARKGRSAVTRSLCKRSIVLLGFLVVALAWRSQPAQAQDPDWDVPAGPPSISYTTLVEQVRAGNVVAVTITGHRVAGTFAVVVHVHGGDVAAMTEPLPTGVPVAEIVNADEFTSVIPAGAEAAFVALLQENGVTIRAEETGGSGGAGFVGFLNIVLSIALIVGIVILIGRGLGRRSSDLPGFGRSRARRLGAASTRVTFADVAGEDDAKEQLAEVVDFLRSPADYERLGAHPPRGVLLLGPPGTGKTLLAKAVAGEAGVSFFSIAASEFVEMYVGVGASRVRDLFRQAKQAAPAIVFVDELDAVGRHRGTGGAGVHEEREQTLNQLLVELDGFELRDRVVVLAATNRPDVLDAALLRPGRFDRRVTVGLPDRAGREAILRVHAACVTCAPDVDLRALAAATPGFAGADLANLVNEAAMLAARRRKTAVERVDLDEALDRILLGSARPHLIGERERRLLAYHEAGHALVAHRTPGADAVRKVSIVPRGQALGVTIQAPLEDRFTYTTRDLLGRLAVLFGGRAAERLVFDDVSTGAEHDLKAATALTRRMVGLWGMSEAVGPFFLGLGEEHAFLGGQLTADLGISDALLERAEAEAGRFLAEAEKRATSLLVAHRPELDRLAAALLVEETIGPERVLALLGPPEVEAHDSGSLPLPGAPRIGPDGHSEADAPVDICEQPSVDTPNAVLVGV